MSIPTNEIDERILRTRKIMEEKTISALVVTNPPDIRYLSNYAPFLGGAVLVMPTTGDPVLVIDKEWDVTRAKDTSPISDIKAASNLGNQVSEILVKSKTQGPIGVVGWNSFPASIYLSIKASLPTSELQDSTSILAEQRMVKSQMEIELIRKATKITDYGAKEASEAIEDGKTELEIARQAEVGMKVAGSEGRTYPASLGSGERTNLIVPLPTLKKVNSGEHVVFDIVASYAGYHSDISRTKQCGNAVPLLRDLYEVVIQMYKSAISAVKSGVMASEVHEAANLVAKESGFEKNIMHHTGHGIGLDVEEMPELDYSDKTRFKPGFVHTIEPGLYVAGLGGVRVEDMVLITESGREILSTYDTGL